MFSFSRSEKRSINTGSGDAVRAATWRRAYEFWPGLAWLGYSFFAATCFLRGSVHWALAVPLGLLASAIAARRLWATYRNWRARSALLGFALDFLPADRFKDKCGTPGRQTVWFGSGFSWTPEHAQKLYELSKVSLSSLIPPSWIVRLVLRRQVKDPESIGLGALHGIGAQEEADIEVQEKTLEGGTLIVGTTQAGKGVLMSALISEAILRGDTVIVLDPKNSPRLRRAVMRAAKLAGREQPLTFHPGSNEGSVRLNPLSSFTRESEIASRITACLEETGPFAAFAWNAVHIIVKLMVFTKQVPTIASIYDAVNGGFGSLLIKAITQECGENAVEIVRFKARESKLSERDTNLAICQFWEKTGRQSNVIREAVAVYRHDPVHYEKITASLLPVLSMLTSGPLRESLSPSQQSLPEESQSAGRAPSGEPSESGSENQDEAGGKAQAGDQKDAPAARQTPSERPLVTLQIVCSQKSILYVATDALPDPVIASSIGAILLSDLASLAGSRYNRGSEPSRISLFVDECANVINRPLIELLNKGAESGIRTTCAMQTVSDLAARLGSQNEARMALGNFNTVIALRTKDLVTQQFVTETFGKTYIAQIDAAVSSGSHTGGAADFASGYTRRMTSRREEIIPADALGKLPNCEFFGLFSGGRLVKGRIPILTD